MKILYFKSIAFLSLLVLLGISDLYIIPANAAEPSSWAVEEIEAAKTIKAITETLSNDYQDTITRSEFIELLVKSYESIIGNVIDISTVKNPFKDTDKVYLIKAYTTGISKGTSATAFSPDTFITREEMVVMMVRMIEALEANRLISIFQKPVNNEVFADEDKISDWALEDINKAVANGIVSGVGEDKFDPKGISTREQAVVVNYRLLLKVDVSGKINEPWREHLISYESDVEAVLSKNFGTYEESGKKAFVIADILNMRSTPDLTKKDNIIRKLKSSEEVIIIESVSDWYKIVATGEEVGYVHSDYIHIYSLDSELSDIRMQIIAYAKQFIGTPYRYGGSDLAAGVDCSGFTGQVVRPFGYILNRSSKGQGSNGIAVSESELEIGDLVLYGYSGYISHVALYAGSSRVIHATVSKGVKITDMRGYLRKPVIGFRRVIF